MAEWEETPHGPRPVTATTWAAVSVESEVEAGWSRLVTCRIDDVVVGAEDDPLGHRRGRYVRLAAPGQD